VIRFVFSYRFIAQRKIKMPSADNVSSREVYTSMAKERYYSTSLSSEPQTGITGWRWKGTLLTIYITCIINGMLPKGLQ
jgi:hypothetical protein